MSVRKWVMKEYVDNIDKSIEYVEEFFEIRFPEDFVQCVRENNAGGPLPYCFYFGDNGEAFNNLLTFNLESQYSIINTYNRVKNRLPRWIVPFGEDPFGNFLCFDYRNGDDPIVVFFINDYEPIVKKVCNTFTELLDMLQEHEEEELGIFIETSAEDE